MLRRYVAAAAILMALSGCRFQTDLDTTPPTSVVAGPVAHTLRDQGRALTIEDVRREDAPFIPHETPAFSFGLTRDAHWIRIPLAHPAFDGVRDAPRLTLSLDYATLEDLRVYAPLVPSSGSPDLPRYAEMVGGWGYRLKRMDSSFLLPSFELPAHIDRTGDLFVRIETTLSANFRISVADAGRFAQTEYRILLAVGLMAGVLVAMGLYNLVLFFMLRDRTYLVYLGYLAIMLVYQSSLAGLPRLIDPAAQALTTSRILVWSLITVATALAFSWSFLDVPRWVRQMRPVYYGMWLLCAAGVAVFAFGAPVAANGIAHGLGLLLPFVSFSAAGLSLRNGNRVSLYFIAASAVLLVSVNVFALRGLGIVPHNYVTTYGFFAAANIEAVLYSFALADRVKQLHREHSGLKRQAAELTSLSMTDELTGLYNRRFFERALPSSVDHAHATVKPLSLVYVDLDGFKQLNDSRGHGCGDTVLRVVGSVIRANVRSGDFACRIGGDEFALILPGAHAAEAQRTAERIRDGIEQSRFGPSGPAGRRTEDAVDGCEDELTTATSTVPFVASVSIGVAELATDESAQLLVNRADRAMYRVKAGGGNGSEIDPTA